MCVCVCVCVCVCLCMFVCVCVCGVCVCVCVCNITDNNVCGDVNTKAMMMCVSDMYVLPLMVMYV